MTKKIFCYLFVISLIPLIFSNSNPTPQEKYLNIFHSPTKSNLKKIIMLSDKEGYILADNFILKFSNNNWEYLTDKKINDVDINNIFLYDNKNILIETKNKRFVSELLLFSATEVSKFNSPLMNNIFAITPINKNLIWFGGDRELIKNKNNKPIQISFPANMYAINKIYSRQDESLLVFTSDKKAYELINNEWHQFSKNYFVKDVFAFRERFYYLIEDKIYLLNENKLEVFFQSEKLKSMNKFILTENEIWASGTEGKVIRFYKNNFKEFIISEKNINDMFFINNELWLVGNNGFIVNISNEKKFIIENQNLSFNQRIIYPIGKFTDDEYGVILNDFNNDGKIDIYNVCIFDANRININKGNNIFSEEANQRNITGISKNKNELFLGASSVDIDNDGDQDIYLCNLLGQNKLYLNNGKGFFRDVSSQNNRASGSNERSNAVVFGDVDNDGDLDLFVTNEYSSNRLFINDGNGYFTEITKKAGLETDGGGMCAAFADINGDDKLDLYVTNWAKENILYLNISTNDKIEFKNITKETDVAGDVFAKSNGCAFADIDNDGDLDLFVANRKTTNRLYRNEFPSFREVTKEYIGLDSLLTNGICFADFDNDGYQDLVISNIGENIIYKNLKGKRFEKIINEISFQKNGYSTGMAVGDIDNDGDIDLYIANYIEASSSLYLNNLDNKKSITIKVKGTISNKDAIGTKIWVYSSSDPFKKLIAYREINAGSGYASQNSKWMHIGLDTIKKVNMKIYFPSSNKTLIFDNIVVGSILNVDEESGFEKLLTDSKKTSIRLITNLENQIEIFKIIVVLTILFFVSSTLRKRYKLKYTLISLNIILVMLFYIIWIYNYIYDVFLLATLIPIVSILIFEFLLMLTYERKLNIKKSFNAKLETRDRIAKDLHDDLASTLSTALLYNNLLNNDKSNDKNGILLGKINNLLTDANNSIADIVWIESPGKDYLDELVFRIKNYISELCELNSIIFNSEIDNKIYNIKINEQFKRNIYLIFKEAMNNLLKYSKSKNVKWKVEFSNNILTISLIDDGIGFELNKIFDAKSVGNGIKNMQTRTNEIGGELKIFSEINKGTEIIFNIKMT